MAVEIEELAVLDPESGLSIFSDPDTRYTIPLYQRAYSWSDAEIEQLIDDVYDAEEGSDKYYIGSLIVFERGNCYEVIDGQQRLTTLMLLLAYLRDSAKDMKITLQNTLSYDCRQRATKTFSRLVDGKNVPDEECDKALLNGYAIIENKFRSTDINLFMEHLSKVRIFRIPVPAKTDLNRYFEIMNTRGEQLEQHDVLKASLMSSIIGNERKAAFAKIWEACSDMSGYVQMHFDVKTRERFFGDEWQSMTRDINLEEGKATSKDAPSLEQIFAPGFTCDISDGQTDKYDSVRFESIIEFPYFLLHVLKVFIQVKNVQFDEGFELRSLIDDKHLTDEFKKVMAHGSIDGAAIGENLERFSEDFASCLLKCRYLFDKYIVKREYANETSDGEWSLKELRASGRGRYKKACYRNTRIAVKGEWDTTSDARNKKNLMLQSALRISYTSPKVMHWITYLLAWLYEGKNQQRLDMYCEVTKNFVRSAISRDYLNVENRDHMGVETPRVVFNYLDYLLWERNDRVPFTFEFRNSVEHWYPQNPSEDTFEKWKQDDLDSFGNLCIVTRNVNSRFSNMAPMAKRTTFEDMIAKGSLKLREMSRLTTGNSEWLAISQRHGADMLKLLKEDCAEQ